ncbi:MAG: ABC transporter permease [Candidatus Berkelbacteria bacterium]|nr:ABC transporter permease [Candidatus Berkelbacteria bacterium]
MEILRNMWRRKFRTFLTIFGIVIGMFAFTVMGSMALKFNKMIDGGKRFITGQISIMPKGGSYMGSGGGMLPVDTLNKIAQIEGVDAVAAGIELSLEEPDPDDPTGSSISFGTPPTIEGTDLNSNHKNRNWLTLDMKDGRMLEKGDSDDKIVIGYTIALDKKWHVSDKVKIRGREFEVIGIIDKTMTGPDSYVFMPITPARELFIEANPFLKSLKEQSDNAAKISDRALAAMPTQTREQILQAKSFKVEDVNTMAAASWKDGEDSETVSNRIKDQFKDEVLVLSPVKMGEEIDKATVIFNAIILGVAIIALVVGGFSIINTMVMSISERTKEIGIKKAMGASSWSIAREYSLEAGIIGLLGGGIGMGLGVLTAILLNNKMASKGAEIFLIQSNFLIVVIVFSFIIGIIAGIIPAFRAARMKAVDAIREL